MIGTRLSHYRLLEQIGAGGMGVVYRARDEHLDRDVAVKVLPVGTLTDDDARQRFRREAHALSRLNHSHIATVHDFDTQDGVDFLVMELVEGQPLDERVKRGPLPEAEVCALGAQIAEALGAAHEQGIVHRDLKPGNVVLAANGQAKVLDFGLARLIHPAEGIDLTKSLTETGVVVGTIPYMAPEQLLGRTVDARADLYSLGVVLYELATGRSPYRETIPTALVYEIVHQAVTPPRVAMPRLSPRLEAIILNCMEKDPGARYPSARALAGDLKSSIPVARRGRRMPRAMAIAGATLTATLAILLAFDLGGLRSRLTGAGRIESLAVLPLQDLSGDSTQAYFADGMTDELINRLAQISALRVTSRSSTRMFKGTTLAIPEIARRLKVDAIIEGSVRRSGDRVRIAVQLVLASTDKNLWGSSFERDLGDVFALQSEMAQAIAGQVRVALTPQERTQLAASRRVHPEAHEEYLKGRYALGQFTEQGFLSALGHFRRAIDIDPGFALAHVGVADAYSWMATLYIPPAEAFPKVSAAAERALALDPELPEALAARGYVKAFHDWDWAAAEVDFRRSIELDPGNSVARFEYGALLVCLGRFDEAIRELRRAHDLDPLSRLVACAQLWPLFEGRRYDAAIEAAQQLIKEDSEAINAHHVLVQALTQKGEYDRAIAHLSDVRRTRESAAHGLGNLAYVFARQGRRTEALHELELQRQAGMDAYGAALVYGALGMKDEAFAELETEMVARRETVIFLKVDPQLDPLRSDPRYDGLLRRLGFGS